MRYNGEKDKQQEKFMKRLYRSIVVICLMLLPTLLLISPHVVAVEEPTIYSNEALVVNVNTDEVLYHKDTNKGNAEIASLTKVMISVLSVENITDLQTQIVVPAGTRYSVSLQNGSHADLQDGYSYSALDLLYGLMLPSGCDAADTLGLYMSGGDYQAAVDMMNAKAKELGMENTIYYSISGLAKDGKNNRSTEQDLYKLAKHAFNLPYFQQIVKTEFHEITGMNNGQVTKHYVQNTNSLIGEYNGAEYYFPYSLGGKTGHSSGAGRCYISFAKKGDLLVAIVTQGVPHQHHYYHFADHRLLLDYVFQKYTENITVEIGSAYKSVGIGDKIQLIPETSEPTNITWHSSDESVAEVNAYGIVTGKKLGQAKITATTETGNVDYVYVSVGFYNGVDVKYSSGPSDPNGPFGYGQLDWTLFKDYGIDFAIIRAGYALDNIPKSDPFFVTNVQGALDNKLNVMVSFDGYATNTTQAKKEAEFLVRYLSENIPQNLDRIKLPIVYNLSTCSISNGNTLTNMALTFQSVLKAQGYDVIVEVRNNTFSAAQLKTLTESNIGLYIIKRPYVPDHQTRMLATGGAADYPADLWQYRSDAYFGKTGIAKKIIMSTMYMDAFHIDTAHEKYDESKFPEKPELRVEENYTYTGAPIEATVAGFDPETMEIQGNVSTNAGTYTVTVSPKVNWKDGSKDPVPVTWVIGKATPEPENLKPEALDGTPLRDIFLPSGYEWINPDEKVDKDGENRFRVIYTPEDTENYLTVEMEITVQVQIPEEKPEETKPTEPTDPEETKPSQPTEPEETIPTQPTDPEETKPTQPTDPENTISTGNGHTVTPQKKDPSTGIIVAAIAAPLVVCILLFSPKFIRRR